MVNSGEKKLIQIVCPICERDKELKIPSTLVKKHKHLTTISIPKGVICEHHFQAFIDKNFRVRGYQQVDFEFPLEKEKEERNPYEREQRAIVNSTKSFRCEENNEIMNKENVQKNKAREEMSLKEVYEKYWHLIEDDSKTFQNFIKNDKRRKKDKYFF
ncbi:MAG: hypothetical protein ACOC44_09705 [Promethearchaeia archaeon]